MSARKCANYRRLNGLPTELPNGPDLQQQVPTQYQLPAWRMVNRSALRAHCQRLLYFLVFYALLAGFFFFYMSWFMYFEVSRDYPKLTGAHSALGMNPGLGYVPHPDIFNSLIRVRARDPERPCSYDVNAGGPCNMVNGFGYDTAQPCFALKMTNIYGWLPDPIDGADGVLVKCEGYDEDDTAHLGTIRYFDMDYKFSAIPPGKNPGKLDNGTFRSMYFPYRNQLCYHQPLVFVQFDGITRYTLIRVRCYLIAKNIHVDFERGEGSVSFEIIDD
ncbi:unnamed protein product [Dibothriocephalus latus]|uniref:Sodium/potassium-transporting ATPase subunit beta n=1 Tax=Dibothriocephalus latus TaxID=60516 RepID=A0A3P6SJC4_DIBLA|nr:unnamed protein product [Dibothriocephalus latus]